MSLALMIHKVAMLIAIVFGIACVFKKSTVLKKIHYISAIIFVLSILWYFIDSHFNSVGYIIYGLLTILTFFSPKLIKNKGKLLAHTGLFAVAICWLVIIHII